MNKFIFFQNAADDANIYPLTRLKSIEGEDSIIKFTFDVASGVDIISVALDAGANELPALKAIAQLINSGPHGDGVIVIADDVAGVYAHSSMASVGAAG